MTRHAVLVEVTNLNEVERDALNGLIALLTDPGLDGLRRRFFAGRVGLVVEDDEITWPAVAELHPTMEVAA